MVCKSTPLQFYKSPIRDEMYEVPRPIGEKKLYNIVNSLYFEVGLLKRKENGRYDPRVHSLRKSSRPS